MKKYLPYLFFLITIIGFAGGDVKICQLPPKTEWKRHDILIIEDSSCVHGTKQATIADVITNYNLVGSIGGGGTLNSIPLWSPDGSNLGNSYFKQNGDSVIFSANNKFLSYGKSLLKFNEANLLLKSRIISLYSLSGGNSIDIGEVGVGVSINAANGILLNGGLIDIRSNSGFAMESSSGGAITYNFGTNTSFARNFNIGGYSGSTINLKSPTVHTGYLSSYAANYGARYTARTLIDKRYADSSITAMTTGMISGSGTVHFIPEFSGGSSISNSPFSRVGNALKIPTGRYVSGTDTTAATLNFAFGNTPGVIFLSPKGLTPVSNYMYMDTANAFFGRITNGGQYGVNFTGVTISSFAGYKTKFNTNPAEYNANYGARFINNSLVNKIYVDSSISAMVSGGTVTSVATSYGLTGGTITTTGTLKLDTTYGNAGGARPATQYYVGTHSGSGTVTSVSFTGGLISVANATTTPALTVAGTSGGVPYFSSSSTWASSTALTANSIMIGGGAGSAPSTTTTGTGVLTALGVNTGSAGAFVVNGGALGTPLSGTATNLIGLPLTTGVTGILPATNGGTGVNNGSNNITIAGNLITTGAFNTTFAASATGTYTLPTATSTLLANNLGLSGGSTLIGGTGIADILNLQGTSGNGTLTSAAIKLLVGNNGATTSATILNNGRIGIGTTAPNTNLEVFSSVNVFPIIAGVSSNSTALGTSGSTISIYNTSNTAGNRVGVGFTTSSNDNPYAGIDGIFVNANRSSPSTRVEIYTASSGTRASGMLIDENQNVGIGSATPAFKLDVVGAASASGFTRIKGGLNASGGVKIGAYNSTIGAIWSNNVTPSTANYMIYSDGANTQLNATSQIILGISDGTTAVSTTTGLYLSTTFGNAASRLHLAANSAILSSSSWLKNGIQARFDAATYNMTNSGTIASAVAFSIGTPTFQPSSTNTITDAATFYVNAAPVGSGGTTITNAYSIWSASGTVRFDGGIKGTITNDNATSLNVGEYTSSLIASGSAVSLTTATPANVTSISLTAGDWDVDGGVNYTETLSTVSARTAGLNSTSATIPTDGTEGYCGVQSTVTSEVNSIALTKKRFSLSATTTIYLVGQSTFSAGTCAAFGSITARRVR